jgi:thymidylate synthase (FAD)
MNVSESKVKLLDSMGSDLTIVNAARVSFEKESKLDLDGALKMSDEKLIRYLALHNHTSPFNHVFLQFRVAAPLFVARQLVKHKFLVWNEVSRRYVDTEPDFYLPKVWRKRAENVKQGSSPEAADLKNVSPRNAVNQLLSEYQAMLEYGVCPEQARMILPQNMMTSWYWSGSLGAFTDMVNLRLGEGAQVEAADVAEQVKEHITELFPVASKYLIK